VKEINFKNLPKEITSSVTKVIYVD